VPLFAFTEAALHGARPRSLPGLAKSAVTLKRASPTPAFGDANLRSAARQDQALEKRMSGSGAPTLATLSRSAANFTLEELVAILALAVHLVLRHLKIPSHTLHTVYPEALRQVFGALPPALP
jgi:hypothetical protein